MIVIGVPTEGSLKTNIIIQAAMLVTFITIKGLLKLWKVFGFAESLNYSVSFGSILAANRDACRINFV